MKQHGIFPRRPFVSRLLLAFAIALPLLWPSVAARALEARASLWMTERTQALAYNVDVAIERLTGTRVEAGEEFSFNGVAGAEGYETAPDGTGLPSRTGGVDRVATALYRALKSAGLEIVEAYAYGEAFAGGYVADGAEAIEIDAQNARDLRFVNSAGRGLRIILEREGDAIYCSLVLDEDLPAEAAPPLGDPYGRDAARGAAILVPRVTEYLSLRNGPNTDAAVLEKIYPGMEMELLDWSGIFARVRVRESGSVGYVHSGYVEALDGDFSRWPYGYAEMNADIEALVSEAGGALQVQTLSTSLDGRAIPVLRFGAEEAEKHILIQGGVHGREAMTCRLTVDLLRDLIRTCPGGIEGVTFHVIPMLNPDGVTIAQQGPEALDDPELAEQVRAILRREGISSGFWKANARGVDLNRNFPEGWEALGGRQPASSRYRGETPLSEPESQALAMYLDQYAFHATISYHSYGSVIYWQGASRAETSYANAELANLFSARTGYPLIENESSAVEKGGFKDWALAERGIPSITVEIGSVDSAGTLSEYTGILLRHVGSWQNLAGWVADSIG